jgi:hypothetical protein
MKAQFCDIFNVSRYDLLKKAEFCKKLSPMRNAQNWGVGEKNKASCRRTNLVKSLLFNLNHNG